MTIGVGFLCTNGIVLCSDRQITDHSAGFKFEERKIFYHMGPDLAFVFSYAGEPDAARSLFGKISDGLASGIAKSKASSPRNRAIGELEKIFRNKDAKGLQTLIGIRFRNSGMYLFKTANHRVVHAIRDYIGVGDSSALRYLCDFLLPGPPLDINEAGILGAYIVSVASRYVDGCGGGPDITAISKDGTISEGTRGPWPNGRERFARCEEQIGKRLRELLLSGGMG